jgi:hypothetical protein
MQSGIRRQYSIRYFFALGNRCLMVHAALTIVRVDHLTDIR